MSPHITDLCWMDQDTLIVADQHGLQLVKYTIDRVTRTCTGQVLDSGYLVHSVSCSQGGLVFTTEHGRGLVRVYNVSTGHRELWDTNITLSYRVRVSVSAEFIVLSPGNNSYVHNQDRAPLYSVTHDQVSNRVIQTYVTDTGVFWGTVFEGNKLLIMDLYSKVTKISTEGIVRAFGVSGTKNGYVYVTDQYRVDVGVYSADGTYLHRLQIDRLVGGGFLWYSGAISLSDTEDLIAFCTLDETTPVAVYRTHR